MAEGKDPVALRPNGGSGRSSEIAADIDRTRDALDRTVDAIVGKLTPSQLLMEAVHVFRSGSSSIVGRVVETAREHPVPATIVATGLGMMLWERSGAGMPQVSGSAAVERVKEKAYEVKERAHEATAGVAETLEGVKGTVQEGVQHAKEAAHQAKETVSEKLHEVKDATQQAKDIVREKIHDVKEEAQHLRQTAHQQVKQAKIGFWQAMDQQPLVLGGIALALGAAAALMLPATEKEGELMGEASERLRDKAGDVGRQVLEKGKHVARAAGDVLREEAREQGLTPDQLAEKVRTVARGAEQAAVRTAEEELGVAGTGASSSSGYGTQGSGGSGGSMDQI